MAHTMRIRKGDVVQVISGKDRGKQGRVIEALPRERRVVVENLNMSKRHVKPRPIRQRSGMGQPGLAPGGVIDRAAPLPVSNVMIVCPACKRATRVGVVEREGKGGRIERVRVCRRDDCQQEIDR
jgi:large subunit ribosomal protein L24